MVAPSGPTARLARAVRQGAICYLDEVVEARKDTTVVLHPLADDRRVLPIERTGEQISAAPGFMLVVSFNPGYQNVLKSLKPSTRQRFIALEFPTTPPPRSSCASSRTKPGRYPHRPKTGGPGPSPAPPDRARPGRNRQHPPAGHGRRLVASGIALPTACQAAVIDALTDDAETAAALAEVAAAVLGEASAPLI